MAAEATPKIVLVPHERSHPFSKRECSVQEALKVGRSVDRRRISQSNLIFDCRVLSRNHALIWYDDGKFFIKDTKSSNGTFVNDNRLSQSGQESEPVELKSRDVLQFGVNVNVEKKVTHGCIIATVRLYINDMELPGRLDPPIQQVMQIVKNSLAREQELENKLASMQDVINSARSLANESMIAIVKEDELLSRLQMLENQLQVYSRNSPEDDLKKQLAKAFEEAHQNELTSKDSLRAILQEKLECMSKLNQLQRDYDKAEQECQRFRTLYDTATEEHSMEVNRLSDQVKGAEQAKKVLEEQLSEEKQVVKASLDSLQAEADFARQQLEGTRARLEEAQDELFQLKVKAEAERQRKHLSMESVSTSDSFDIEGLGFTNETLKITSAESNATLVQSTDPDDPLVTEDEVATVYREMEQEGAPPINAETIRLEKMSNSAVVEVDPRIVELEMRVMNLEEERHQASISIHELSEELALAHQRSDSDQLETLQSSLSEAEERVRSLEADLQVEIQRGNALQATASALGGQLNSCFAEMEAKHTELLCVRGDLTGKDQRLGALDSDLARCQTACGSLQSANTELEEALSSLRAEQHSHVQAVLQATEENAELTSKLHDLKCQLDRAKEMALEVNKPHFLDRPGSPTAESKRANLLMIVAVVAIGVAVLSWLV